MKLHVRASAFTMIYIVLFALLTGCGDSSYSEESKTALTQEQEETSSMADVQEYEIMKDGVGIICGNLDMLTGEVLKTLKNAGIEYIRIPVPYPFGRDGKTVSKLYEKSKTAARRITEHGMRVFAQSFTPGGKGYDNTTDTIGWMSNIPGEYSGFEDESFYKTAQEACRYIAEDLKDYVQMWLVSNEPDINVFTGDMTIEQICDYIFACVEGIKTGNSEVKAGVNMFACVNPPYTLSIMEKLYGDDSPLDFLGLDAYFGTLVSGGAESWEQYINDFSNEVDVPIIITEWSYSSAEYDPSYVVNGNKDYNNDVCRYKKFNYEWGTHERNDETQAKYITECMKIFSKNPNVIGSFWFCVFDYDAPCWECGEFGCPMYSSWGMLNVDHTPKPALNALKNAINNSSCVETQSSN